MLPVSERLGFIIEPWQVGVNANTEALTEALCGGVSSKVATRGINFGILIKIPQKVELDLP